MVSGQTSLQFNPIDTIKLRGTTKRKKKIVILTLAELVRLVKATRKPYDRLVVLCGFLGLRTGECLALRWDDFSEKAGTVEIQRSISSGKLTDVRTDASHAILPVPETLMEHLQLWKNEAVNAAAEKNQPLSPCLFPSRRSKSGIQGRSGILLEKALHPACDAIGIARIGFHALRHSYRSWLDSKGVSVARKLGLSRKLLLGVAALAVAVPVTFGLAPAAQSRSQPQNVPEWQTAAGGKMEFEVATIRQNKPGTFIPPSFALDSGDSYGSADLHGRFSADFPLSVYITFAYKLWLTQDQIHSMLANLPKWVATDSFVIQAVTPGDPTKDQMRLMVQSLLADRFKLAVHFETQRTSVLALVLAKPGKTGPKLRPHAEGPPCSTSLHIQAQSSRAKVPDVFPPYCGGYVAMPGPNNTVLVGSRDTTMKLVAASLPSLGRLGRPVVDQTGLSGRYDFTLEWTPESTALPPPGADIQPDSQGPTFLEALQEQLGLKLKPTKARVDVLVIDHVERPSPN